MERKLAKLLKMKLVEIQEKNVFIGHGYAQHGGYGCTSMHCFPYNTYIVLNVVPMKAPRVSTYDASFGTRDRERAVMGCAPAFSDKTYEAQETEEIVVSRNVPGNEREK